MKLESSWSSSECLGSLTLWNDALGFLDCSRGASDQTDVLFVNDPLSSTYPEQPKHKFSVVE